MAQPAGSGFTAQDNRTDLGAEGKKKFIQKNPHTEISKLGFRDIIGLAKVSFEKTK